MKNAEENVIAKYIDSKNIVSLRPILTKDNENLIAKKTALRVEMLKSNKRFMASKGASFRIENNEEIADDIDDLEEIIGDDAYGAFLDSRAEIQVGAEIYKYTDAGLFIVKAEKYDNLLEYLAIHNISDDLLYATPPEVIQEFIQNQLPDQVTPVTEEIDYFNAYRIAANGGNTNTGGGSTGGGGNPPVTDPNQQMANFINGLQNCSPENGLFDGVFGDSDICTDRYEDRYRVKTKAYNYNYYLVYNLGV